MRITPDNFKYDLPPKLIAQQPAPCREGSRLMHLNRSEETVQHAEFKDLPDILNAGDLLVVNNTRVIPARFFCRRKTGGIIEGLFLRNLEGGNWEVLLKDASRCTTGEEILFRDMESQKLVLEKSLGSGKWLVRPLPEMKPEEILDITGHTPLPPYIRRPDGDTSADRQRYQTIFAESPGAVAAPTAGLHFTREIIDTLEQKGVESTSVTLHVGLGTFAPIKVNNLSEHKMHSEWFEISPTAADAISDARDEQRRIVAVGTTSVRVLESVANANDGRIIPCSGTTDLFIYPPSEFTVTDALLTNFHLPGSTLLMLVAAFCSPGQMGGIDLILDAYKKAVDEKYRFFSYGDAMLIE